MTRREALLAGAAGVAPQVARAQAGGPITAPFQIQKWDFFEVALRSGADGNPFLDVSLSAEFRREHRIVQVNGFYDGDGTWRVRFSPDAEGEWTFTTISNRADLNAKSGRFVCIPAAPPNHGYAAVNNTSHFAYADGTPYFPFGTTCYAWTHQSDALEEQTLETLKQSGSFNKIRMCVFPKWYSFNHGEPRLYPFERRDTRNDYTRFNPAFFQHLEKRVGQLRDLGIEADLILFHPYDNWGFSKMPADVDERYLRYVVARLAAYRNVWWSIANEWDLFKDKKLADFDRFFRVVQQSDPYQRLRSIHHSKIMYDHAKPWVTHASIQDDDFSKTQTWLDAFRKPVIFDECKYEGNISQRWGNLSGHEMTRRFWLAVTAGAYGGHGETFLDPHEVLWWSKGGTLHGESAPRIAFLRHLVEQGPAGGLNAMENAYYPCAAKTGEYYLHYFDYHQPAEHEFTLPDGNRFQADIIDPWKMTITPVAGLHSGKAKLALPGLPFLAVRFRKVLA
jgi:hypothetical protein